MERFGNYQRKLYAKAMIFKNNMKGILIAVIVIAVIAIVGAYFIGQSSNKSIPEGSLNNSSAKSVQIPNQQTASLENQKQCATDGNTFFQNWLATDFPKPQPGAVWKYNGPEYHFNQKLNACLIFVEMVLTYAYDPSSPSSVTADYGSKIFDVYANKLILESWTLRKVDESGKFSEKVDFSSLGSGDFYAQKKILMSE